jgi:hypothetical protein
MSLCRASAGEYLIHHRQDAGLVVFIYPYNVRHALECRPLKAKQEPRNIPVGEDAEIRMIEEFTNFLPALK